MRIAVTGGSGGIGRAITSLALSQGHSVVSIDRIPPDKEAAHEEVPFILVDTANYTDVERALEGCDALVHMAAIPSPGNHPDYVVHNNNVVGSYNALYAAARLGIARVCQASSVNATGLSYSRAPRYDYFPLDEAHPTYNEDPYSLSKWVCEQQGDSMVRRYEWMTIASMRFHWVVGERDIAARHANDDNPLHARNLWGYTSFDAAARACLQSLTADFSGHEAFYIVAPETILDTPSLEMRDKFYPNVPVRGDLSGTRSFFDSSKAERMLGWRHHLG